MESSKKRVVLLDQTGQYIRQPSGYRAFIPRPLPPTPPIRLDALLTVLSQADQVLGRLDGSIQTLPNADLFVKMYVRKESVLSNQIEGTQSSLHDVLGAEASMLDPDRPKDVVDVINHVEAMNYGLKRLATLPLSVRLIREIHAILLQNPHDSRHTPGELRTSQNWIGPIGCTLNEATFVPPPPHEVPTHMSALEKFLHADTELPLLIKIGLAHAQFETIHPFLDGNGRVGRLLITLMLCEQRVLIQPVLYLSYYFKQHRQQYYDILQSMHDTGNWEQWLEFFLIGVIEVSRGAIETTRNILTLREQHQTTIATHFDSAAGNGHRTLDYLYDHPIISISEVQAMLEITYPTANSLIKRMVTADILHEITGRTRNRRFIYQSYIDLFHEDTP